MRPVLALALLLAAVVAGCGEAAKKQPQAPVTPSPKAGVVDAEATKGLLGPATEAEEQGVPAIIGQEGPIAPKEDQPTDAQRNGVAGGVACASTTAAPAASNMAAMNAAILCLLNAERASKGLPALRSNGQLGRAARLMANLMVKRRFFSHDTPDGRDVVDRVRPTGYIRGSWSLGENIAWGSGALATPRSIVNGWMHSPGHRANILRAKFRDIGIGIRRGAPGRGLTGGATYVTDFGRRG